MNGLKLVAQLYLDDRLLVMYLPNLVLRPGHTVLSPCLMAVLMTMLGGFVGYHKSQVIPVKEIEYLGFRLDSVNQTVEVPERKYDKAMDKVKLLLEQPTVDVKLLQQVRGRICSWLTVIPIMQLFIREQNTIVQVKVIPNFTTVDTPNKGQLILNRLQVFRKNPITKHKL